MFHCLHWPFNTEVAQAMMRSDDYLAILDELIVDTAPWGEGEDILSVNGKPVGSTFARGHSVDAFWSSLKRVIATHLEETLRDDYLTSATSENTDG